MQNKTKTYLLLVAVLAIWGVVAYQVFFAVGGNESVNVDGPEMVAFTPNIETYIDTFSVQTVNRDPFLGTFRAKTITPTKVVKKATVAWLPVKYHGNIKRQNKKNPIYIISIDGSQYLMKKGQEIKEVKLINGNDTRVTMRYKGEVKQIEKI